MSLALIEQLAREQAEIASEKGLTPYPVEKEDIAQFKKQYQKGALHFPFPNIGDYRPEGWELVDTLFVDSSGFGNDSEPALSVPRLLDTLEPGYGYAIIQEGQFQLYLGKFEQK